MIVCTLQNRGDFFNSNLEFQVRILTDAVDDITTIDDFLAVSENHILDDVNNCVGSVQVIFCFLQFTIFF